MDTTPMTDVPVTMGPPVTTPPVTASLGTQVPYYPGTFQPGFYTPTGLTQQGARALQPQILPNPFTMYSSMPLMTTGQLTQWGQFHPGSTTETYLLTEGARRDSQWDPVGVPVSRILQGGATANTSSVWREPLQGEGNRTPPEKEVSVGEDDGADEEDPWMACLTNLERGQYKIQRDQEEAILTIPEIV
ncbi:UNVERIFIED_CONTAM: hypothetical protein K2H54_055513, partial [Gekko kuhli]